MTQTGHGHLRIRCRAQLPNNLPLNPPYPSARHHDQIMFIAQDGSNNLNKGRPNQYGLHQDAIRF